MIHIGQFFLFLLACIVMWILIVRIREQRRRLREGYWLQYLGWGHFRDGQEDFGFIYHEGEQQQLFGGQRLPDPARQTLLVPEDEQLPPWLKGRREVVIDRIKREYKHMQIVTQLVKR